MSGRTAEFRIRAPGMDPRYRARIASARSVAEHARSVRGWAWIERQVAPGEWAPHEVAGAVPDWWRPHMTTAEVRRRLAGAGDDTHVV